VLDMPDDADLKLHRETVVDPQAGRHRTTGLAGRLVRTVRLLAVVALCVGVFPVGARWLPLNYFLIAASSAAMPLAAIPLIVALILAASVRWLIGIGAAALALGALVAAMLPMYVGTAPSAQGATALTVMSINMRFGEADAQQIVAEVKKKQVDVLAAEELTPAAVANLRSAGLETILPNSVLAARKEAQGTGLWTRFAIGDHMVLPSFTFAQVAANATLDDGQLISLWAVHPVAPVPQVAATWAGQVQALGYLFHSWSQATAIVSGDFNSSTDNAQLRNVLTGGFQDAARSTNAGWVPTFPADWPIPPFMALDHTIYRGNLRPASFETVRISGTDHLGIVTRFVS
jgi:endonuclease/exonuclease/phosphatase (EEP) superfamily protein YafD